MSKPKQHRDERAGVAAAVREVRLREPAARTGALRYLERLCPYGRLAQIGLTEREAIELVKAVGDEYPLPQVEKDKAYKALERNPDLLEELSPVLFDESETFNQKILLILAQAPYPTLLPYLLELYPRLKPAWQRTRWQALTLLGAMPQREAAVHWARWHTAYVTSGGMDLPSVSVWPRQGLHADVVMPVLLQMARVGDMWRAAQWYAYVRAYAVKGQLSGEMKKLLVADFRQLLAQVKARSRKRPGVWMWQNAYHALRYKLGAVAETLGAVADEAEELRSLLALPDPYLQMLGALALIEHGLEVEDVVWEGVAAWAETRWPLYERLAVLREVRRFPKSFRSRELLVASEMLNWLMEDGEPPMPLEFLGTMEHEAGDFYVFAFSWRGKSERYIGLSGPWLKGKVRKADACGLSNSFCAWEKGAWRDVAREKLAGE